jgi:hypothetical protein
MAGPSTYHALKELEQMQVLDNAILNEHSSDFDSVLTMITHNW